MVLGLGGAVRSHELPPFGIYNFILIIWNVSGVVFRVTLDYLFIIRANAVLGELRIMRQIIISLSICG